MGNEYYSPTWNKVQAFLYRNEWMYFYLEGIGVDIYSERTISHDDGARWAYHLRNVRENRKEEERILLLLEEVDGEKEIKKRCLSLIKERDEADQPAILAYRQEVDGYRAKEEARNNAHWAKVDAEKAARLDLLVSLGLNEALELLGMEMGDFSIFRIDEEDQGYKIAVYTKAGCKGGNILIPKNSTDKSLLACKLIDLLGVK